MSNDSTRMLELFAEFVNKNRKAVKHVRVQIGADTIVRMTPTEVSVIYNAFYVKVDDLTTSEFEVFGRLVDWSINKTTMALSVKLNR